MSSHSFGLIELLLVFGVVIGWAVWQLYTLRRDNRRTRDDGDRKR